MCRERPRENKENCTPPITAKKRPVAPRSRPGKKRLAFAIKRRARARCLSTSTFVGLVVAFVASMRKVAGSNPIAVAEVFADYSVSVSEVGGSIPGHCKKKIQLFLFRLCPCLAGDPIMKFFSQLNPAHRGRAKFPRIVDLARITASSATAPAELKSNKCNIMGTGAALCI